MGLDSEQRRAKGNWRYSWFFTWCRGFTRYGIK